MKDSKESLSKRIKRYGKKINYVITDSSVRERKETEAKNKQIEQEEKTKSPKIYHTKQRIKELKKDKKSAGVWGFWGFMLILYSIYSGSVGQWNFFIVSFEFIIGLIIIVSASSRNDKLEDKIKDLEYELKVK